MKAPEIIIEGRRVGPEQPPYIVAEVSANHNGSLERAREIITMAHEQGADAVKLQTYTPDTMTIDCDRDEFMISEGLWQGYSLYDLYKWAQTPFEWQEELFSHARSLGITVFSTPFDETAVELLNNLDAPAYKIASFENVDLPLIARTAQTHRPLIISTGMADLEEIHTAVECARDNGCRQLALLHCISAYPAPIEQANLRTISDLAGRFGVVVGLSDHTLGTTAAVASIALGASIIEKHVILDRSEGGPDAPFSLEPSELRQLVNETNAAWSALGTPNYERLPAEQPNVVFRRSIFVVRDIKAGEAFTQENLKIIRPGNGMAPRYYQDILGTRAVRDMKRGDPLTPHDINTTGGRKFSE